LRALFQGETSWSRESKHLQFAFNANADWRNAGHDPRQCKSESSAATKACTADFKAGKLIVRDWEKLAALGEFDSQYLHQKLRAKK
jgi:hypothetical protein